jgi:hypothetical protein
MNTRRDFLSFAFKGSAMAAATAFLSGSDPVGLPDLFVPVLMRETVQKGAEHGEDRHRHVFSEKNTERLEYFIPSSPLYV